MYFVNEREEASVRHADLLMQADVFRAYFCDSAVASNHRVRQTKRVAGSVVRAVEALTQCQWDCAAKALGQPDRGGVPVASCTALQAIVQIVHGDVRAAERLMEELQTPGTDDEQNSECWAVSMIARSMWTYATGRRYPELELPNLVNRLIALLPDTAQSVRDLLCFSLALVAVSQQDAVLASFLLGHKTHALAASSHAPSVATTATRAAFGFSIVALGDAETGRRILLAVSNDGSRAQQPLFKGFVDAELVGLQSASGDLTSASHWLARTQRFAKEYDCDLLFRKAVEARERPSIAHHGGS